MSLDDIARAVLGAPLTPDQQAALDGYLDLLQRWNATYNLTAVRDPAQMRVQHVADCLAVIPPLRRWRADHPVRRVLDVGSGAGLPAVVIAAMEPDLEVVSVDAVGKKAAFVRQAAGELRLPNLRAEHARVEQLQAGRFELITSRAFASLADFVRLTQPQLADGGAWMAMKGKRPDDELAALPPDVAMFHVEPLVVPGLDAERCLVWLRPSAA
jgi:16S rRNA (guanine527-N7)-methyltransferase